jgi:D-glycero-D-manno-heptose 1,7-bisphosphate phosphatase
MDGEAVRRINDSGFKAVLITNQAGVERGFFPESTVHEVHSVLDAELSRWSAHLDAIYYCPHRPETQCDCRKPKPGMILRASREMNIDLGVSYMIGDRYVDVEAAHSAGVKAILLRSGDGLKEMEKFGQTSACQPHFVADNLLRAVEAILGGLV